MRSERETRKILEYFLTTAVRPGDGGVGSAPPETKGAAAVLIGWVARVSGGVMTETGLLEHLGDHLFQRRVFHAHIGQRVTIENRAQELGHARPLNLDVGEEALATDHFSEPAQVVWRQ